MHSLYFIVFYLLKCITVPVKLSYHCDKEDINPYPGELTQPNTHKTPCRV